MWKNIVVPDESQGMRIACWVTKATNTHSERVILIAFPLQKLLQERVSMLRYTLIACRLYLSLEKSRWVAGCGIFLMVLTSLQVEEVLPHFLEGRLTCDVCPAAP
jgi:hypothetical protein